MLPLKQIKSLLLTTLTLVFLTGCGGGGGDTQSPLFTKGSTASSENASSENSSEPESSKSSSEDAYSSSKPTTSSQSSKKSSSSSSSSSRSSSKSTSSGVFIDMYPPTAPGALQATQSLSDVVIIVWSASVDNVEVTDYRIYRDGELLDTIHASELEFHDFNVAPNKSYIYAVSAGDVVGNWSTLSQIRTTTSNVSRNQPSSTSTSSSSTSSAGSTSKSSLSSKASSHSATSLSSTSSASSSSSTPTDKTPPATPTGLRTGNIYPTQIDLLWNANIEPDLASYKIFRNGNLLITLNKVSSYSDTSAAANTSYTYQISAGDTAGNWSPSSALIQASTPASQSGNSATLSWHTPTARVGGAPVSPAEILGYQIRYKRQTDTKYTYTPYLSNNTFSYTLSGLNGTYVFQIAAIDSSDIFSLFVNITPN